jgi:hypothetical protein
MAGEKTEDSPKLGLTVKVSAFKSDDRGDVI